MMQGLIDHLFSLGIRPDGLLLVHSSLRSLGSKRYKAETVIDSLLQILGNSGTLLIPALSYETVTPEQPHFDIRHTPSCVGALSEVFRLREGILRSMHPTHSVCGIGPSAKDMLSTHGQDATPCGPHSPFHKLKEAQGQILFLGCGLQPNTSMHGVEELIEPPYLFADDADFKVTDIQGQTAWVRMRCHDFAGWEQRYDRIETVLHGSALRKGKVLEAECHIMEACDMWAAAYGVMQEDPLYFVDRKDEGGSEST